MLSWQRTAFHFQPEENWMNGMVRTSRYFNFFLFFFYKKNGLLVQKSGMPFG
jgi:beta-fructofuranosidase